MSQRRASDRWVRSTWLLAAVIGALVIAFTVLAVKLASVEACINDNLGKRSAPSSEDAAAHIEFARAVEGLFLPKTATPKQRAAESRLFKAQVRLYVNTLVADQAQRDRSPLGQC